MKRVLENTQMEVDTQIEVDDDTDSTIDFQVEDK